MWWPDLPKTVLCCCLALIIAGCGYKLPAQDQMELPGQISRLHLDQVHDNSGQAGMQFRLRALLKEEIQRRTNAKWTDRELSQGLFQLDIESYRVSTLLEDSTGQTVKSQVSIRLSARIVNSASKDLFWESGEIAASESFVGLENSWGQQQAESLALERAVQSLVQRLGQRF